MYGTCDETRIQEEWFLDQLVTGLSDRRSLDLRALVETE